MPGTKPQDTRSLLLLPSSLCRIFPFASFPPTFDPNWGFVSLNQHAAAPTGGFYGQAGVAPPSGAARSPVPGQQQGGGYTASYNTIPPAASQQGGYSPAGYTAGAPAPAPGPTVASAPAPGQSGGRWGAWLTGTHGRDGRAASQAIPAPTGGPSEYGRGRAICGNSTLSLAAHGDLFITPVCVN